MAHYCGNGKCEESIQEETKAVVVTIPFENKEEKGKCILCGADSNKRVLFAKTY